MTSTFRLALDTHAPSVAWGAASGTTAGELLRVPYVSDEPLHTATLVMADGRRLALTVAPDHVEALLPPDAPDGWAAISVADDVGNARTYTAVLQVSGTAVPPPAPPTSPGVPAPAARGRKARGPEVETRVLTSKSTISTTSSAAFSATSEVRGAVSTTAVDMEVLVVHQRGSEVGTAVSIQRATDVTSDSGRRLERKVVVRRRDSPDTEALLLLL